MYEDTPLASRRRYEELLRRMTPAQRVAAVGGLCRGVRRALVLSLRAAHPGAPEAELRARIAARLDGREAALRLFGSIPDDAR